MHYKSIIEIAYIIRYNILQTSDSVFSISVVRDTFFPSAFKKNIRPEIPTLLVPWDRSILLPLNNSCFSSSTFEVRKRKFVREVYLSKYTVSVLIMGFQMALFKMKVCLHYYQSLMVKNITLLAIYL